MSLITTTLKRALGATAFCALVSVASLAQAEASVAQFNANVSVEGARIFFQLNPQSLPKYSVKLQDSNGQAVLLIANQEAYEIELNRPGLNVTAVRPPTGAQLELRGAGCARAIEAAKFSNKQFNIVVDARTAGRPSPAGVVAFTASCVVD